MNKMIRECAVCSVLTVAVVTGWGKTNDCVIGSLQKVPPPTAVTQKPAVAAQPAPKVSAPAVAAPKETPKLGTTQVVKPVTTPTDKSAAVPVAKSSATPGVKPVATSAAKPVVPVAPVTPKAVASAAPAATQKALKVLDGGAVDDTDNGLRYQDSGKRLVSCDPKAVAVTIKKEVELIHGNAFRGCTELLRVHFLGDAPNAADEVFADLPRGCTIYVEKGRKGWPNGNANVWKGVAVRSADEIKTVLMDFDGRVKINGIGYKMRACGDGVALSADLKFVSESLAATLVVPEKIGNAPVRILGDSVFPACTNLVKVIIPASVTNFSLAAFSRCGRPRQIEIGTGNTEYRTVNGTVYEVNSKTVIMAGTDVSTAKVPADALTIGPEAFKGCDSLTSVELPATLKSIGKGAFAGCMGLSVVTVPADAEVAADAFEGCCATIRKVGSYRHYDGFAGAKSEVRWMPDALRENKEGPFVELLPLRTAVERASKGDGAALYALAIHCAQGNEVKRDPARAMEYLRKAVSAKDANAEFLLGLILESRMAGSDLNDPTAPGIAGRFAVSASADSSTGSGLGTPFERYVGTPSSTFADSKRAASASAGSLANEKDYELVRGVYETAERDGCSAAGVRLEHLSYLSKLEFERVEKDANQRLLDGLKAK